VSDLAVELDFTDVDGTQPVWVPPNAG